MGGFAIPAIENRRGSTTSSVTFVPTSRWALKTEDVVYMMKNTPDLIPDIPEWAITDRAGADGLRKALLVFQVLSFFLNFVERWAQGLDLSLLEVCTASRGLCCLATYAVWFSKPLNVDEPTMILPVGCASDVVNVMLERYRMEGLLDTDGSFSESPLKGFYEC